MREPQVLILDEATSALDVETRDRLFAIVARLASEGIGVVFISHRMDEIEQLGDRITVMRSGDTVATVDRGSTSPRELVRLMTGAEHLTGDAGDRSARHDVGDEVLHARNLVLRPGARAIDFRLRAGELVGLAGLEGHGQATFLHALRGQSGFGGDVLGDGGPGTAHVAAEPVPRTASRSSRASAATRRCSRDADPRQLRAAHPGGRHDGRIVRPSASRDSGSQSRSTGSASCSLGPRRDQHPERRQPAEGRASLAGSPRARGAAAQRSDAGHRHRRQARPLRAAHRLADEG